jgi:hypothetical protein
MLDDIFDMKLNMFRSIKDDLESKIDLDVKLSEISDLGILKSYKFPFLTLSDSRNFNKICKNENFMKTVYENSIKNKKFEIRKHLDLIYRDYLPRSFTAYYIKNSHYDLADLYKISKKGVNTFSRLELNPIISEGESNIYYDWFVYDDESLNFLMSYENKENSENDVNKNNTIPLNMKVVIDNITKIKRILFQDKLPYMILPNKEYKSIFLYVRVNQDVRVKIDSSLTTTAMEILIKVNNKLNIPRPELSFDPKRKLLKVLNLCDYFLDVESPIGLSAYITECIKQDQIPELVIVDNPILPVEINLVSGRRRSSSLKELNSDSNKGGLFAKLMEHKKPQMPLNLNKNDKPVAVGVKSNLFLGNNLKSNVEGPKKIENPINLTKNLQNPNINITAKPVVQAETRKSKIITDDQSKDNIPSHKLNINNIGVFNPQLLNFSEFKGIRKRNKTKEVNLNNNENHESKNPVVNSHPPDNLFFGCLNFNEILKNNIQKKLKIENEKSVTPETKDLDIDVDNLIKEKRTRTKGIRK